VTSNYDLKPLTQVCEVLSGGTPKTTVPEFWNGNIPWASVKDFNINSRWFSKTEKSISQLGLDSCSSVLLEPGDLVISARGTVGVVGQCKMRTSFNQSNYGLRAKSALSKNDYLYYALSYAKRALISDTHGGMFDTITRVTLDRLLIPVPTLKVQEQIAEILGSLDMKIAVNNSLSKTLEDIAQTIFKSWFIDFDPVKAKMAGEKPVGMNSATAALFPGTMEESELGLVPKGWEIRRIDSLCETLSGGTPSRAKNEFWGGEIPWINSGKVNDFRITAASEYITELGLEKSATKLLPKGTTVLAITGATLGQFSRLEIDSCANQSVVGIVGSPKASNEFIYLNIKNGIQRLISAQTGGAQQHINKEDVNAFSVIYPGDKLMSVFTAAVEKIFAEIGILLNQSTSLSEIRDSLLPRLISGELQIPEEMLAS
jgi:type I restriction enzyme S subunit